MNTAHATRARYGQGCRCDDCRAANAAYQTGYRSHLRGADLAQFTERLTRNAALRRSTR